jgi:CHAD domain-containing protein
MLVRVIPEVARAQAEVTRAGKPEAVLRLRQGLRRLRVLLGLLHREAPSPQLADLRDKARTMTAALGPLRALDAFRLETLPRARRAGLSRLYTSRLAGRAAAARADALTEARTVLASDRLVDFGPQLSALPAAEAPALIITPAAAAPLLRRLHRRMLVLGAGLGRADSEARHRLRLAGKALVALAGLIGEDVPLRRRAVKRAAELTAAIGSARDREQALAIVADFAEPKATTALAETLERIAGREERRIRRCWKAFRKAPPPGPKRR